MDIFFTYPGRFADVYKLSVPNGHTFNPATDVVRLDDGTTLSLTVVGDSWVSSATKLEPTGMFQGRVWKASLVFVEKDSTSMFQGDWDTLLPKINAAAAVNTLFVVRLPQEEYSRLLDGGLDDLKRKLSPRAASLVALNDHSSIDYDSTDPALDLYRTGSCP